MSAAFPSYRVHCWEAGFPPYDPWHACDSREEAEAEARSRALVWNAVAYVQDSKSRENVYCALPRPREFGAPFVLRVSRYRDLR